MLDGGLEIDQTGGPAGRDFLVHAPFLDVPVLIDMGGGPDLIGIAHAVQQASASSAEPVRVVTTCSAATDQGSAGKSSTRRLDRRLRLG